MFTSIARANCRCMNSMNNDANSDVPWGYHNSYMSYENSAIDILRRTEVTYTHKPCILISGKC